MRPSRQKSQIRKKLGNAGPVLCKSRAVGIAKYALFLRRDHGENEQRDRRTQQSQSDAANLGTNTGRANNREKIQRIAADRIGTVLNKFIDLATANVERRPGAAQDACHDQNDPDPLDCLVRQLAGRIRGVGNSNQSCSGNKTGQQYHLTQRLNFTDLHIYTEKCGSVGSAHICQDDRIARISAPLMYQTYALERGDTYKCRPPRVGRAPVPARGWRGSW